MRFSDTLGNRQAVDQVRRLIDSGRLPHALLLHGQAGVPKLALARAAAQYLHCSNRHDGEPCGVCPACRQHQSNNNTDTFFSFPYLKRDSNKDYVCDDFMQEWNTFLDDCPVVEDYRHWLTVLRNDNSQPQIFVPESSSIVRKMSLSSMSGNDKVLIMWLPEKMMEQTANKLLKLIEEPYHDCRFILVSDNASAILPTIYSRVQRIELKPLSTDEIAHYLVDTHHIDLQDAIAAAGPANGNAVDAERALDRDNENREFHQLFVELMRLSYKRDLANLKRWSETVAEMKREKTRRFLAYASAQVRENFMYNLHTPGLNYLTREEEQFSLRFAPFICEKNVEAMHSEFNRASQDIQGNGNARIVLFDMAMTITVLIKMAVNQ